MYRILKRKGFMSGYAASGYDYLANFPGMDCFSIHLFLPLKQRLAKTTTYQHVATLQSSIGQFFLSR